MPPALLRLVSAQVGPVLARGAATSNCASDDYPGPSAVEGAARRPGPGGCLRERRWLTEAATPATSIPIAANTARKNRRMNGGAR